MASAVVNKKQCEALANFLRTLAVPTAQEEHVCYAIPDRAVSNLYFAVAICHQTTPHRGPALQGYVDGVLRRGWDYLREKWIRATEADLSLVSASYLAAISAQRIEEILYDEKLGSTISDARGRALLLNDIGRRLLAVQQETVRSLYGESMGYLSFYLCGWPGLIYRLGEFEAYGKDPVQKKAILFPCAHVQPRSMAVSRSRTPWHAR